VDAIATQGKMLGEAIDKIRQRSETTAKALGGLGTTVVTAVGIAKFSDLFPLPNSADLFPFPKGPGVVVWIVVLGFLAMAMAVLFVFRGLLKVNEPIIWQSDVDLVRPSLSDAEERRLATEAFDQAAELNSAPSLRAYEARGKRLRRIARHLPVDAAEGLMKESQLIRQIVDTTLATSGLVLIRRRASRAFRGWGAIGSYFLFVVGLLAFGIGADYLESERTDAIAVAKSCAEARTAGAANLPTICGDQPDGGEDTEETPGSLDHEVSKAVDALSSVLVSCEMLVTETTADDSCDRIRDAIATLVSS
jgi:hypothetical protein